MRVLMLCNKSPFPSLEGGSMAMEATVRGLAEAGARVDILAIESEKYKADAIPDDLRGLVSMDTVLLDLRLRHIPALWNLMLGRSYHIARFQSRALNRRLTDLLAEREYDVVQFETPFLGSCLPLVRRLSKARIVLRAHNVEHRIWERLADQAPVGPRKFYLRILSRQLRLFEKELATACDGIAAISDKDADWFRTICDSPVLSYPYGRDAIKATRETVLAPDGRLFHLGSMNWRPNEEGIAWMLGEVWPLLLSQGYAPELHLAGRHMPDWIMQGHWQGVEVYGEVPDSSAFMQRYGIMVVPLLSGSGLRIKIIEGMEAGRAIVSTTVGAEGIPVKHGEDILLADSPDTFATCIVELMSDNALRERLGRNARAKVTDAYDNRRLTRELVGFYDALGTKRTAHG